MTKASKTKAKSSTLAEGIFAAFPAAFMANLPNAPTNNSANWWEAYMTNAIKMNEAFMGFVATRWQHDTALCESLAKCSDWADAAKVQQEWMQQMSEEYAAEAETLMQLASSTVQEGSSANNEDTSAEKDGK